MPRRRQDSAPPPTPRPRPDPNLEEDQREFDGHARILRRRIRELDVEVPQRFRGGTAEEVYRSGFVDGEDSPDRGKR
jgi:hypothetical protein